MLAFIMNIIQLSFFNDLWQGYLNMGTAEKVIIGIVVFALAATMLYFLYRVLDGVAVIFKGIFWILKSIIFLVVCLLFSLFWLIFLIPFGFFKYRKFSEISEMYKVGIKRLKFVFYPKMKKDLIMTKEEIAKKVTEKDKKGDAKAKPSSKPEKKKEKEEMSQFHCSNCGAGMPTSMVSLLKSGTSAFCEACGQKFKMEGGVPYPVD